MNHNKYKLVMGHKQADTIIAALALLETENEVSISNLETALEWNVPDKTETKADIVRVKAESERATELRHKLLRMLAGGTND